MPTPPNSIHAGGPGNPLALFATSREVGAALSIFFPCEGVALDGSNVTHAAVVVYTDDGYWHTAGDLADAITGDPIARSYLDTLPAFAVALGDAVGLPGVASFTADLDSLFQEPVRSPHSHRSPKPGRIMRALGFRQ